MDHLDELLDPDDRDRAIIGFDGDDSTRTVVTHAVFTADGTRIIEAFRRLTDALRPLTPLFALIAKHMRRRPATPRRTGRKYRRIVRTPGPGPRRDAPAAPSALTTAYTRRYHNRQGCR